MSIFGLYIHIPFCVSKCSYCSFVSAPCKDYQPYVNALCKEIELKGVKYGINSCYSGSLDTIYFGGGTPSLLSVPQLQQILAAVRHSFSISNNAEISLEVNPASASREKLDAFRKLGVNRLSVGLQCANDKLLALLGRPHDSAAFVHTVNLAHSVGITNVSADLIIGLPTQTLSDVSDSLNLCFAQGIKHLSCYALKVERGTPLYKNRKNYTFPDDDLTADMYELCLTTAEKYGMHRYEVSNFALDGWECRHNLKYWRYDNYLAVGASASGFVRPLRYDNLSNVAKYIERISNGHNVAVTRRRTPVSEQHFEYVMLGLRLDEGIDCDRFAAIFGKSYDSLYGDKSRALAAQGLLYYDTKQCRVEKTKMGVLNGILTQLLF